MKAIGIMFATALLLLAPTLSAQTEKKGDIKNTVGVMTEPVIRARLKALGYTDIRITKTSTLRYKIESKKEGKAFQLDLHPQTGEIHEVEVGKTPAKVRVWTMPVEPVPAK